MPCSGEYPESHVRQLNTPQGAAEELRDLLEPRIGNFKIELAYSLWGINAPDRIELTYGTWLSPVHISLAALTELSSRASSLAATFLTLPPLHSHSKLGLLSKMHCDFLFCVRTGV